MRSTLTRIAALGAAAYGLLYVVAFFAVAATEHGDEPVSWPSFWVIAGQAVVPAFLLLAVLALIGGLVLLGLWALLDGDR